MSQAEQTQTNRIYLNRIILVLQEFRKISPDLTVAQALTLTTAAAEPGLTITEIKDKVGLTMAACSRHIELLGPKRPAKGVGLDLLEDGFDEIDRRRKVIKVTPTGRRIVTTLIDIINR